VSPVPAESLDRILRNAVRGPSAGFSQGQAFLVLGALYFGIVPEAVGPFREAFGVPDDHEPIGAIAIGYDAEAAPRDLRGRRRPAAEVIHYGRW
jgi:nitroreductase